MTNPSLQFMRKYGIPLTHENFLQVEYFGTPPEEIGGELLAEFHDAFTELDAELLKSMGIEPMEEDE